MKRHPICFLLSLVFMTLFNSVTAQVAKQPVFKWGKLASIPDNYGFAGSFAGVSNGALIVAGGANFPDGGAPWTGSAKVWHDDIFVLESTHGKWRRAGKLPQPLGYGASVTWRNGLICLGGSNASGHFADVFVIKYKKGKIETEKLPSLPYSVANTSGVLVGDVIYIAGGLRAPDSKVTEKNFWSMDLTIDADKRSWTVLDAWPGDSRMLAVVGTQKDSFYLFSGTTLVDGNRQYLQDAYKYSEGKGWEEIASLPVAVVAAPSPAYAFGKSNLFIFGGDDGKLAPQAAALKNDHPGFSADILSYNIETDRWTRAGKIVTKKLNNAAVNPNASIWAPVTTPLVNWNGNIILPGGEVRPAVRTSNVLIACPVSR